MKKINLLVTAVIGAGFVISASAFAQNEMGEAVEMDSLPAAVQKTIKEKAAGGEIVAVRREDDKDGKWNYEARVKQNDKEWEMEVSPEGKFVKKHEKKGM